MSKDPGDGAYEEMLKQVEAELAARLQQNFMPLPDDFDFDREAPARLAEVGFPPRPDPEQQPELYALWRRFVARPLLVIDPKWPLDPSVRYDHRLSFSSAKAIAAAGHRQSSRNWAGAIVVENSSRFYTQVASAWQVPNVSAPAPPAGPPRDDSYRCSTWIGLDGHIRFSNSMPQMGTLQQVDVVGGQSSFKFEAWVQWWVRGENRFPVPIPNLPIRPGDRVYCWITVEPTGDVLFDIRNDSLSPPQVARMRMSPPTSPAPPAPPVVVHRVRGGAAEWVAERPMVLFATRLYPLPNYGSVTFEDCLAVTGIQQRRLRNARLPAMVERRNNPVRARVISRPAKVDDGTLEVVYKP
jgi:hypothetical protein